MGLTDPMPDVSAFLAYERWLLTQVFTDALESHRLEHDRLIPTQSLDVDLRHWPVLRLNGRSFAQRYHGKDRQH